MANPPSRFKSNLAIAFVAVAAILLLGNVQIFRLGALLNLALRYWPLILLGIGFATFFSGRSRDFNRALFFTIAGLVSQVAMLGWLPSDLWQFWPFVCIALGLWLLVIQPKNVARHITLPSTFMNYSAMLQGTHISATSSNFSGGEINARLAMVECDFGDALPAPSPMSFTVKAILGNVTLIVPESWHVTTEVTSTLASLRDTREIGNPPVLDDTPRLYVTGSVMLGSLALCDNQRTSTSAASAPTS